MRVFVWEALDSLAYVSTMPGFALAHAESKEQAIRLICEKYASGWHYFKIDTLRAELESVEPRILDESTAYVIEGGS